MTKDQFNTGDTPFIRIESCAGDLILRGWSEPIVQVKGIYQLGDSGKGFVISSSDSLHLRVPRGAALSVGRVGGTLNVNQITGSGSYEYVHGDANLSQAYDSTLGVVHGDLVARNVMGALAADEINGDVVARGTGNVSFGAIHGDLSARLIDGSVTIDMINGDADLRTINGDVTVNKGFRDINLNGISGRVAVSGVTGDIRIRSGLTSGDHTVEARGDIVVRWPVGLPINLSATGTRIDNRLQFDEVTEKQGILIGRIGEGETNLTIATAGRVILREEEPADIHQTKYGDDMEFDLNAEMAGIASRIETEMNARLSRVSRELESKFGPEFNQNFNDKILRKMEKASERVRRRQESRSRVSTSDISSSTAAPAKKPLSTEEQMKILKMVETGKITPEEAGMLLEALEE